MKRAAALRPRSRANAVVPDRSGLPHDVPARLSPTEVDDALAVEPRVLLETDPYPLLAPLRNAHLDVAFDRAAAGYDLGMANRYGLSVAACCALLAQAGFRLERDDGRAWIGSPALEYGPGGATVRAPIRIGTPLYRTGIERGDVLVSLDGESLSGAGVLNRILQRHRPGDRLPVVWRGRGGEFVGDVVVESDPNVSVRPTEALGGSLTEEARAFRNEWLSSK